MLILCLILFPMLSAPVLYGLGRRHRTVLTWGTIVCTAVEWILSAVLALCPQTVTVPGVLLSGMTFGTDGFRTCYGLLAAILWLGSALFSVEYFRDEPEHMPSYWAFMLLTLGAMEGLFLSADFMTAFYFFEMLSLCSFPWVMHERSAEAIRAGCTYLAVAIIGGLVLFLGLLMLWNEAGTLSYAALPAALATADPNRLHAAGICILLGFGAKAGMFPLHIWLPKAHPVAPAPASALLSGMLTKAGVYGVLMTARYVLPDSRAYGKLLLCLGLVTMALGAALALFSVNLKHTLACSSMSQIGFILTGVASSVLCRAAGAGEGAALALSGTVLHMVNHALLKLALFLSAGAVAMNLHALNLNDIRGWGRNKHLLKLVFLVAALGISGVPGFNGYLSKTLLHEGLTDAIHACGIWSGAEWVFLCSGGLTLAYMCKLFLCIFVERNADPARQAEFDRHSGWATPLSSAVLAGSAVLLLVLGIPGNAMALSRWMTETVPEQFRAFSPSSLSGALISLGIGTVVYVGFVRPILRRGGIYRNLLPGWLDLENTIYRPLLLHILPGILEVPARLFGENKLLRPLCRGLVWLGSVIGRALDSSLDAMILLLRGTAFRGASSHQAQNEEGNRGWGPVFVALQIAFNDVVDNFSYAMVVACAGIVLILFLLLLFLR